jgi:phosphohistidine phosphatase
MKTLFLLRHAKSSWDDPLISDFDRPLNKRGKSEAVVMGKFMKANGINPELIVSSSAKRARKTAKRISREIKYPKDKIIQEDTIYEATVRKLLEIIIRLNDKYSEVMLIGHNPGFSNLAAVFTDSEMPGDITTCGLLAIDFDIASWKDITKSHGVKMFYYYPEHADVVKLITGHK